jgi:predicted component of type VI protein secretion system
MKLSLVVLTEGKQRGKVLNISLAQFLIGRDPQCHLRPASPMISKRHCAIIQRDGKIFIRDFDSTNGTLVNDQAVKGEIELHHDDQLKVGPLLFAVRLEASPPVNRPTPAPPTKSAAALAASAKSAPGKAAAGAATATPPPTTEPATAASGGGGAEDDIAALLLSLDGDSPGSTPVAEVPEGSTVMDVAATAKPEDPAASSTKIQAGKPGDKDKKKPDGNTSSAAKSILEKYMRRPRS